MRKHYIYNCLLKNDAIILWITSIFSVFHYLYFYSQEGISSTVIVLSALAITSIGLIISMKLKVVINLYKNKILLMFTAILLACLSSIKENTNDITSLFVTVICLLVIVFSILTIKEMIFSTKIGELADDGKTPVSRMRISEVIGLYKLKTYEVISNMDYDDSGKKHKMFDDPFKKYSLFFDYRLNMRITNYDMISLDDGKEYSLPNFAEYCKENNVDLFHLSKEDFEVYKMMII